MLCLLLLLCGSQVVSQVPLCYCYSFCSCLFFSLSPVQRFTSYPEATQLWAHRRRRLDYEIVYKKHKKQRGRVGRGCMEDTRRARSNPPRAYQPKRRHERHFPSARVSTLPFTPQHHHHPLLTMTNTAPKTYSDLAELLKDDSKIQVAGLSLSTSTSTSTSDGNFDLLVLR